MERTNVYLESRQMERLDRLAADEGVSRAEIIRRLLDRALSGEDTSLDSDLSAIDDSFGVLLDLDAPSGGAGGRDEHLARMWKRANSTAGDAIRHVRPALHSAAKFVAATTTISPSRLQSRRRL